MNDMFRGSVFPFLWHMYAWLVGEYARTQPPIARRALAPRSLARPAQPHGMAAVMADS